MTVSSSFETAPCIENAVVALGAFDGMHLAHRHLVKKVYQQAREMDGNSAIISFLVHPRKIISNDFNHGVLTTQNEKMDVLSEIGIDHLITLDFSPEISNINYADFIRLLQTKINIQKIILGYNHRFGKNREGNFSALQKLGKELHFEVEEVEKQTINGLDISSSSIRQALNKGDVETANKLLGYNYSICVQAFYKKNEIFYDKNKLLPKNGRYIVKVKKKDFILTVKDALLSMDAFHGKEAEFYKLEFIGAVKN